MRRLRARRPRRAAPSAASAAVGIAGVGQGEQLGARRQQALRPDRRAPRRRARRYHVGGLVEPSLEQLRGCRRSCRPPAARRRRPARSPARARAPRTPGLGDVARHPGRVAADRPHGRGQRAAVVGVGVRHPLRPGEHVGAQAQEAVVEQGGDQPAGELDLVVVEQPAERGAQFRERGIDLGARRGGRRRTAGVGGLDPLDVIASVALAGVPGPCRRRPAARRRTPAASRAARSGGPGARMTSERSTSWSSAAVIACRRRRRRPPPRPRR